MKYNLQGTYRADNNARKVRIVLIVFILAITYRIIFNICYLSLDYEMCKFAENHPSSFAALQSTMYILGEVAPIITIFSLHAHEILRFRKAARDKKDTLIEQAKDSPMSANS